MNVSGLSINANGLQAISGGVADLFDQSYKYKAKANRLEASSLRASSAFALEAADITKQSTDLLLTQQRRKETQTIGSAQAQIAAGGFASSGSALDILADSMAQGELERSVIEKQGEIQVRGYEEQARSLEVQAQTADLAAAAASKADKLKNILGAAKIAAGVVSFIP